MREGQLFLPIMLDKREEISMSNGEAMKIAVLLAMYCFGKNEGNRIKNGLKNSKNASWRGLLGLPHKKYEKLIEKGAPGLWHCEGDDIIVDLYSVEMEERRNAKREQASNAGRASAEARKEGASQRGEDSTDVQRTFNNIDKNKTRKEGEREAEGEQDENTNHTIPNSDMENGLSSSLPEDPTPFSSYGDARENVEGSSTLYGARAEADGTSFSNSPKDEAEVREYLRRMVEERSPHLIKSSDGLITDVAHEFFTRSELHSGNDRREAVWKLFNQRLKESWRTEGQTHQSTDAVQSEFNLETN